MKEIDLGAVPEVLSGQESYSGVGLPGDGNLWKTI